MYKTFSNMLKKELKKRIKDDIKIYYYDDYMLVVFNDMCSETKTIKIKDIKHEIINGLSTRDLAIKIEKKYKSLILKEHFIKKYGK